MSDRRNLDREESVDRRSFPRPPLVLNLLLLIAGLLIAGFAIVQRRHLDDHFRQIVHRSENTPAAVQNVREQLARNDVDRAQLQSELQSRADYLKTLMTDEFYLSLDSKASTLTLFYGNEPVREMKSSAGPPVNIQAGTKSTIIPSLRGAFQVRNKVEGKSWTPPDWFYLASNQPIPVAKPAVSNGLGKLIIELPNDYVIHTPPSPDSPLKGAKPGSFMISEEDMKAIWPRVHAGMRVYVF